MAGGRWLMAGAVGKPSSVVVQNNRKVRVSGLGLPEVSGFQSKCFAELCSAWTAGGGRPHASFANDHPL
jgi:hypothetical protein